MIVILLLCPDICRSPCQRSSSREQPWWQIMVIFPTPSMSMRFLNKTSRLAIPWFQNSDAYNHKPLDRCKNFEPLIYEENIWLLYDLGLLGNTRKKQTQSWAKKMTFLNWKRNSLDAQPSWLCHVHPKISSLQNQVPKQLQPPLFVRTRPSSTAFSRGRPGQQIHNSKLGTMQRSRPLDPWTLEPLNPWTP